jgi:hypothetical protein
MYKIGIKINYMTDRIGAIHLKQFIGKLLENDSTRTEVLALVDRHTNTVKSDQKDLVDGLQELLNSPEDGKRNAKELIERFGKMPEVIFSSNENS